MSLFKLCQKDPLLDLLKQTFSAQPIRIPEQRFQPLCAIARYSKMQKFIGRIENLLTDITPFPDAPEKSKMANISARRTRTVSFDLGFQILDGFLKGMGIDGSSLKTSFSNIRTISFSFQNVERHWTDLGQLGNFFTNKKFNRKNFANAPFFQGDASCLVLDSIIVSNNFTMNTEEEEQGGAVINVPAIKEYIGHFNSNVQVKTQSNTSISFQGQAQLAFAFSAINLSLLEDGTIYFSSPQVEEVDQPHGLHEVNVPNRILLYQEDVLIEFAE